MNNLYDVLIIGDGPAGLSAAIFVAKGNLSTILVGDNKTVIHSAWIENYLGFDEPFSGTKLVEIGKVQARKLGTIIIEGTVNSIEKEEDVFSIQIDNQNILTKYLILATGQGIFLKIAELIGVEMTSNDEPFTKKKIKVDEYGRTSVKNVFAAGISTGVPSQAIIAAGSGAQIALNIISELQSKRVVQHDVPTKK